MKAIQFDRLGGPEVLELREVPKPELRPGTVVVQNRVIALNYGDLFFIKGQYLVKPVFPDIPGMEAAGVIEAAAFPIAVLTAWHLLHSCHNTSANQIVLVHSAAGGVGIAAVQIAHAAGAQVI